MFAEVFRFSSKWFSAEWFSAELRGGRLRKRSIEDSRLGLLHVLAMIYQPDQKSHQTADEILRLHSYDETFGYRRLLQKLAKRIQQGQSLPDALEQTPEILTDDQVLSIRLASQSGTLPLTIQKLIDSQAASERPDGQTRSIRQYLAIVGLFSLLVIVFFQATIRPTFSEILLEFGSEMKGPILWLSHPAVDRLVFWSPVLLMLGLITPWLSAKFGWTWRIKRRLVSFVSRSQHASKMSESLLLLADAMRSGRPASGALATLARYHTDSRVRGQLLIARNEIDFGGGLAGGLNKAGLMPEPASSALAKLDLNTDQGWLIRKIAENNLQDVRHKRDLFRSLWEPVMLIGLGLIVLLIGVALMSSLIQMIVIVA